MSERLVFEQESALPIFESGLRAGAAIASPAGRRARLCVLFYHRVLAQPDPLQPDIPHAALFDAQMALLGRVFRVLPLPDAVDLLASRKLPSRAVCVTFDDGYRDNLDIAYPILRRHRLTATFYIASGLLDGGRMFHDTIGEAIRHLDSGTLDLRWLGLGQVGVGDADSRRQLIQRVTQAVKYLPGSQRALACERLVTAAGAAPTEELMLRSEHVRLLARGGMSIGGHTTSHPILTALTMPQARSEIEDNRLQLARLLESPPATFAYPNGKPGEDYSAGHVAMVHAAGYRSAVSTAWGVAGAGTDLLQLPRISAADLPARHLAARVLRAVAWPAPVAHLAGGPGALEGR